MFFFACGNKEKSNNLKAKEDNLKILLNKQNKKDSIIHLNDTLLYVGSTNRSHFAFINFNDSTTLFFQKINLNWVMLDTLHYSFSFVTINDLNGDNIDDLIMTYGVTGAGGNTENIVLLYNSSLHQFQHNDYFDLPNIKYDKKKRLVYSAWWSGMTHPQDKMAYIISGDSLIFKEGVTYEPDDTTQGELGIVEYYKIKENERVVVEKIKGKFSKIYPIFTEAIWDSKDE